MHTEQPEAISLLRNFSFAHKENSKCVSPALVTYCLPCFILVKMCFVDPVLGKFSRHKRSSTLENCCNEMQAKLDFANLLAKNIDCPEIELPEFL